MPELNYTAGQRWISSTEPDLGLGILTNVGHRTVELRFLACDETRTYAIENAPIVRVRLQPNDELETIDGSQLSINSVSEQDGILSYHCLTKAGTQVTVGELELSHYMHFSRPQDRLLAGLLDPDFWFELRQDALMHQQRLAQNELIGLGGTRTELLPHQLYIAREAGRLPHPRILLADEVGLGKTIEACLILHHLLLSGQAERALILVPDPLLHQWLVELMRRFNLQFSLFDEERCQQIEQSDQTENPFLAEQWVLSTLSLLSDNPSRLEQAQNAGWDILIIDEAHHLEWQEEAPSTAYKAAETLAQITPSVLLLTATPEQLGRAGHFARLRLLDPDRYYSLQAFIEEEKHYQPVAEAADKVLHESPLSPDSRCEIEAILAQPDLSPLLDQLGEAPPKNANPSTAKDQVIRLLLDRYGPGRAIFRNTRDQVKGLGKRQLQAHPLPLPDAYQVELDAASSVLQRLTPERLYTQQSGGEEWARFDPRIDWLINLLRQQHPEKLLLICAHAATAIELAEALRAREGIQCALFHEQLSIIERDRAAAWFADPDDGCQLLICSEIGSEGRNFQFAHHLVLFDLPTDPDLLEQRIGRLDRIGQQHTICLHTPYFEQSPQEVLFDWYHQGLNIFSQTCPGAVQILEQLQPALIEAMESCNDEPELRSALIRSTQQLHREIGERLKQGRDHLLEFHSCPQPEADELCQEVARIDEGEALKVFMEQAFDAFGVETEFHTANSIVARPGNQMVEQHFPALPLDGTTATYNRESALAHENWQFLTWEHPMVTGAIDLLVNGEMGNSGAIGIRLPGVKGNPLLLELVYILECSAPRSLQAGRFLPPTLIRLVFDQKLSNLSEQLNRSAIEKLKQPLEPNIAKKLLLPLREPITSIIRHADQQANQQGEILTKTAIDKAENSYKEEVERLTALSQHNINIRPREIQALEQKRKDLIVHMQSSKVRLDSIRMIIGL